MIRVAIVDDSRLARVELKNQLSQSNNIEVLAEAGSIKEALSVLDNTCIDLLLLDIDLPDGTGFDMLEQLNHVPQVIFVTAFNQYAVQSFEYNALDYLLKPVRLERLQKALAKVSSEKAQTKLSPDKRIFIKDGEKCFFVSVDDIFAFEAMGNYTRVHTAEGVPSVYRPIGSIYTRLNTDSFFKASRSWIINTHYIENIDALENGSFVIELKNNLKVNISKRQAVEFKRLWSL
ncbi:LytR/AlgR family response regulator transcription factor [Glaciecola petra]|uniref:LytTR family DNA-binding domain-containing protein n=1 Tax=Glaciecola petra TaxID=3075602 RepID=A0ABU2ZTU2_9ALTE|nr:LytTR family DNA-binding domain-containing protein [Aestuariibacter sp. P117]MDT0596058.1 LytTR family DNA-binding domain-containing protein [Aestuariibacter sp. P117]